VLVDEATEIALQHWKDQWGATTPFVFENEDDARLDSGTVPWARLSIRELTGGQETLGPIGSRKYIRRMVARVQIFVPTNAGMKRSRQLAEQARAVFEGKRVGGLAFDDAVARDVMPDGRWQPTIVEATFFIEHTK